MTIYGNAIYGAMMYKLESLTVVVTPDYRQAIRTALGHGQRTAPNVSETTSHKARLDHDPEHGQRTAPNVLEIISQKGDSHRTE